MPQYDVVVFLKRNRGKKFTAAQLSEQMGYCAWSINYSCNKLIRFGLIKTRVIREERFSHKNGKYARNVRQVWL